MLPAAHLIRVQTSHCSCELLLGPEEVRPGQDDRGVELAHRHVEHAVAAQPVVAGEAAVLLGESLGGHEDVLARHEPEAGQTLLLDGDVVDQGHGAAHLVVEEPQRVSLKTANN